MTAELYVVLDRELRDALEASADFGVLRDILVKYREKGFSSESVYDLLESIRDGVTEDIEERILELMDIVFGFCSPNMRVW
ncbi:hypothetical protein DIE21_36435 [Burkholderia sp. Bp9140]|uniref:hypothetical protein n=1 Tax=Burkholderia sp. Bp9140 TaxID=2184572 RepID=UPI000F57664A|nr:hypothetical protein [Burkholderia sp. Bp9140]RQR42800.1 hypothetical protein DIE21_36435 [Burkholderia sp. Bp9140]